LDFKPNSEQVRSVLVFGLGCLSSGLISALVILHRSSVAVQRQGRGGFFLFLVMPGVLFLVAFSGCFVLCRTEGWPSVSARPWRSFAVALLIAFCPFLAFIGGMLIGVDASVLNYRPMTPRGPAPLAHPSFFYAFPVAIAFIFGVFMFAALLAFALYIFTEEWDGGAWLTLMLSSIAVIVAPLWTYLGPSPMFGGERPGMTGGSEFAMLVTFAFTLYGACAGYWLARRTTSRSVP
jgi:hypothetical protein